MAVAVIAMKATEFQTRKFFQFPAEIHGLVKCHSCPVHSGIHIDHDVDKPFIPIFVHNPLTEKPRLVKAVKKRVKIFILILLHKQQETPDVRSDQRIGKKNICR